MSLKKLWWNFWWSEKSFILDNFNITYHDDDDGDDDDDDGDDKDDQNHAVYALSSY